ncbi:hypothetical protein G7046_g7900 [Stylonectria norvegica]|nr:hypothetical protein G7046_g7900 [Stylonectria norvegica]
MNSYATEQNAYDYGGSRLSPPAPSPSGKTLVEGYRKDIMIGFEKDPPRFNPLNPQRPQSSSLVDLEDPIQVHLLTETALSDSKQYEILSQEEVDTLKKQCQSLTQRVESTRANLTIQSKYRDAAISMAKLYSPGKLEGRRRSLLGRHSGDQHSAREAEAERHASERRCEDLAAELFNLEKRLMEPQRRLLEHTAGILQLTHKASKKKNALPAGQLINGMPGSPESLYTYSRNSLEHTTDDTYFGDAGMYPFDQLEPLQTSRQPRKNAIEIPLKSPIREQHSQLREEMDQVRNENLQLRNHTETLTQSISEAERRLESLNCALRDAIVRFDPAKNSEYLEPPFGSVQGIEPEESLRNQVDYLETGLVAIQAEQESLSSIKEMEQRIELLNGQVRDILLTVDPDYPAAPEVSGNDVEERFAYLEDSLRVVDSELEQACDAANAALQPPINRDLPTNQDNDRVEKVLLGLWEVIQSGLAGIKHQKEERRRARTEKGLANEDDSEDDEFDTVETYSLTGFAARVEWLYRQATTLKAQKSVLKRQIKQQRELNNQSDAEKDEELQRKQEELEESQILIERAEKDAMIAQTMLSEALEDLEEARDAAGSAGAAQEQIHERNAKIAALEADVKQLQENLAATGTTRAQLDERTVKTTSLEAEIERLQAALSVGAPHADLEERDNRITALEADIKQLQENLAAAGTTRAQLEERTGKMAALETDIEQLQVALSAASAGQAQSEERNMKMAALETDIEQLQVALSAASTAHAQLEERNSKISALEADIDELQAHLATARTAEAQLDERGNKIAALESDIKQLRETLAGAEAAADAAVTAAYAQLEERNNDIAARDTKVKELQASLANTKPTTNERQLADVDSMIAALNTQLDEANRFKTRAEESNKNLKKQVETQREDLAARKKTLKIKEDELEELNMIMVETKTELTIAQAELDGAYGSRAERAADVAAIKSSGEVSKLQNQITRLRNELSGTVQELEDVTKETLGAEREKMELETKLDEALAKKSSLEGEVNSLRDRLDTETSSLRERLETETSSIREHLEAEASAVRERLEAEVTKSRQRISKLQEELDGERLRAKPAQGGSGRPGAGASMLSDQFRATMREERKKFQEDMREERSRNRKLEEELTRLKRAQGPGKSPLSPRLPGR